MCSSLFLGLRQQMSVTRFAWGLFLGKPVFLQIWQLHQQQTLIVTEYEICMKRAFFRHGFLLIHSFVWRFSAFGLRQWTCFEETVCLKVKPFLAETN